MARDHVTVGGAPEGFDARLVATELERRGKPVIHVARDDRRLVQMQAALSFFAPDVPALTFPAWECLPYDRISPNPDVSANRMATLAALVHGLPDRFVLLTTMNAATQRVPPRDTVKEAAFIARVGYRIDEPALRQFFSRMGFSQAPTVAEPGDYAIRGGIIDVWPPGEGGPVRLDLFGDELEGARRFDPATQRTTEKLNTVELAPVSEVILDEPAITRFRQSYRAEFGATGDDPLYEAVSAGRKHAGMEHWLPFFHERLETLFEYLPEASICLDDQATAARHARWELVSDAYDSRREGLQAKARLDSVYKPCPPELLYLDDGAWDEAIDERRVLRFEALPQPTGPGVIDAGGRIGRNFSPERQQESVSLFGALADHVRQKRREGQVIVASYSEGARERLGGLLEDQEIAGAKVIADARDVADGKGGLFLAVWGLEHGFEGPRGDYRLTVISEQDVLGDRLVQTGKKKRRRAENFLTEHQSLSPDDLIVHVDHGLGRYKGLEVIEALGAAHEMIHLEYAGGDRLYLPVENIELSEPLRARGGAARQARRRRMAGAQGQDEAAHPRGRGSTYPDRRRASAALRPDPGAARRDVERVLRALSLRGDRGSAGRDRGYDRQTLPPACRWTD